MKRQHIVHLSTYPADDISIRLDGKQLRFTVTPGEPCWFTVITETVTLDSRLHDIAIDLPYAVPTRFLTTGTADDRALGAALANIAFLD